MWLRQWQGGVHPAAAASRITRSASAGSYGVVALGIFGAGFGMIALGHAVRARRIARTNVRNAAVDAAAG